ncbi:MAG: hypothetical protein CME88_17995 [Hirschia sp.]|nr:hypothetical protein [Hirschia sp.]
MRPMRSQAPDIHAPKRDFWRSFRRQLVWLDWQIWMLAHLGLLNSENTASRWLKRQLAQLEHGLRCMLVIGCQNRPAASPAKAGVQDIYQQSGSQLSLGRRNHKRFSYSLKAFGYPLSSRPSEAQTPGPTPQALLTADKWVPASATLTRLDRNDAEDSTPTFIQLQAHIHILADVFTNTDAHIAKMAQQIHRSGLTVRRRRTTRPANRHAPQITNKTSPAHQSAPAICDTS